MAHAADLQGVRQCRRRCTVAEHRRRSVYNKKPWPMWGRGVTDLRPKNAYAMVAGRLLRHALETATNMIREVPCEHKIGMCRCPHERFFFYQGEGSKWKPWLMALLASTTTREGAGIMEASLILQLEQRATNIEHNINWTTSCDYGGEGPKHDGEAHREHFVYLAVVPLPRLHQPVDMRKTSRLP